VFSFSFCLLPSINLLYQFILIPALVFAGIADRVFAWHILFTRALTAMFPADSICGGCPGGLPAGWFAIHNVFLGFPAVF
jgi:hypothetical protein